MTTKLTERAIKQPKFPAKGYRIDWDGGKGGVLGFGIRFTAGGAISFIYNYRTRAGRQRRFTIGSPPAYSVDAARDVAAECQVAVDKGGDPLVERLTERGAPTMADLGKEFLEGRAKNKRTARADEITITNEILPAMGTRKVAEITYSDVTKLHRKISDRAPYRANRVLALLSTMFGVAVRKGWRLDNPAKGVERNHEDKRERYLSPTELERLLAALTDFADQDAANAVRLLLMTGARRGEVLSMTWKQINFEDGTWTKPSAHTKQKKIHTVPLSAPVLQMLATMKDASKSDYVFPADSATGHRVDLKKPWAAICKAAKLDGLRLHDLRHSYASIMVSGGASLPMIGRLLGHTQTATTARYAHLAMEPLREATERVGAVIMGAGKAGADVLPLQKQKAGQNRQA